MSHGAVPLAAGIFLTAFGAAGVWFLSRHFPGARFLRASYGLIAGGGGLFVAWALSNVLAVGVAAAALVAIGAVTGTIGALRKEVRPVP